MRTTAYYAACQRAILLAVALQASVMHARGDAWEDAIRRASGGGLVGLILAALLFSWIARAPRARRAYKRSARRSTVKSAEDDT